MSMKPEAVANMRRYYGWTYKVYLLTFLEGKRRAEFFRCNPPIRVWVSSSRLKCAMNGDFDSVGSSATAYAWFIWERGFKGHPEIRWFN